MGEQFGYQIVVADFNGDGFDDIAISAPTWSKLDSSLLSANYGRVYIFIQNNTGSGKERFERFAAVNGTKSGGQFGWVMLTPGDLDNDGFDDLFVSAPFYVENDSDRGKGRYYNYHQFNFIKI